MTQLSVKKITALKKTVASDWHVNDANTELTRTVTFRDYFGGFMFLTRVSIHAEVTKYYPSVTLKARTVKVTLGTKSKLLTADDFAFATRLDALLSTSGRK